MNTRWLALFFATALCVAQESPRGSTVALAATEGETTAHVNREVASALAKAVAFEESREWLKARAVYDEILARQADHADAKAGKARTSEVLVAELHYNKYIAEAGRLAAQSKFQAAIRRFNEAMSVRPSYLPHDRDQSLRTALMAQNVPVEVAFKSDGLTWVSIEDFRAPHKLESETVKMLPGDYRILGQRNGYEDVEHMLLVRAGTGAPPAVAIACTVPSSAAVSTNSAEEERLRFEGAYQQRRAVSRAEEAKERALFDEELETIRRRYFP